MTNPATAHPEPDHTDFKRALCFIMEHQGADDIIVDARTGLPVKAVYSGPDCTGNYRSEPAVFWFDDYLR